MRKLHPLRRILNRLVWDRRENPADYEITFVHRGAPDDRRSINASEITQVGSSSFTYSSGDEGETVIPFHRVISLINRESGSVLWRSRKHESE